MVNLTIDDIRDLISSFAHEANDRDRFVKVGMCLRHNYGSQGKSVWTNWCVLGGASKNKMEEINAQWRSFRSRSISVGYLVNLYKKNGGDYREFLSGKGGQVLSRREFEEQKAAIKEKRTKEAKDRKALVKKERDAAVLRYYSYPVTTKYNAYCNKAGIRLNDLKEIGVRFDGQGLIIPMSHFSSSKIFTYQRITTRVKLFQKDTDPTIGRGCFTFPRKNKSEDVIFCEGFSTGYTLWKATGNKVVACMSKSGIKNIALELTLTPSKHLSDNYLAFDNDADNSKHAAQNIGKKLAKDYGFSLFIPPTTDKDWNDEGVDRTRKAWGRRKKSSGLPLNINRRYLGVSVLNALEHRQILRVESDLGTGKTYSLKKIVGFYESVLYLVPRRTLAHDVSNELGLNNYQDNVSFDQKKKLVITPNSLIKVISAFNIHYDVIIIDELETFIGLVVSSAMQSKKAFIEYFKSLIAEHLERGGKLLTLDAHKTVKTDAFFNLLDLTPDILVNKHQPYKNINAYLHDELHDIESLLEAKIRKQSPAFVVCDSARKAEELAHVFKDNNPLLITANTARHDNVKQYIKAPMKMVKDKRSLVISSPVLGTGVSINRPYYNSVFAFVSNSDYTGNVLDTFQHLGRVRQLKSLHVHLSSCIFEEKALRAEELLRTYKKVFSSVQLDSIDSDLVMLDINNKLADRSQKREFEVMFKSMLIKKGFVTLSPNNHNSSPKQYSKSIKKQVRQKNAATLFKAKDITLSECEAVEYKLESVSSSVPDGLIHSYDRLKLKNLFMIDKFEGVTDVERYLKAQAESLHIKASSLVLAHQPRKIIADITRKISVTSTYKLASYSSKSTLKLLKQAKIDLKEGWKGQKMELEAISKGSGSWCWYCCQYHKELREAGVYVGTSIDNFKSKPDFFLVKQLRQLGLEVTKKKGAYRLKSSENSIVRELFLKMMDDKNNFWLSLHKAISSKKKEAEEREALIDNVYNSDKEVFKG